MSDNLLRNFTHITIPAEIWLRKDISLQAKCLWAEMRSLHDKERGGCYASDEYLCQFLCLKRSRLHEVFKELKDAALLIVVSFNGRQTIRRVIVPETEYQTGQQLSGKPDTCLPENRIPDVRFSGFSPYIENKADNKEERGRQVSSIPPSDKIKKIERAPFIFTSDKEHADLVKKYGQERIDAAYQKLSLWKQNTPKSKWKRQDHLSIQNWVVDALVEDEMKALKRGSSPNAPKVQDNLEMITEHKDWLREKRRAIHEMLISGESLTEGADFVQFRNLDFSTEGPKIYFKNPSFKKLVKEEISKRKNP